MAVFCYLCPNAAIDDQGMASKTRWPTDGFWADDTIDAQRRFRKYTHGLYVHSVPYGVYVETAQHSDVYTKLFDLTDDVLRGRA